MDHHSLIVRVKRHRDQEPSSTLCIVEDDEVGPLHKAGRANLERQLSALTTEPTYLKKVLLNRVNTISCLEHENVLDSSTVANMQPIEIDNLGKTYSHNSHSSTWVTKGKKIHRDKTTASTYVIVDMIQQLQQYSSTCLSMDKSPDKLTILSPASRLMDSAIALAIRTGDFNGIADAIHRGANVKFQRSHENGGATAVMAAVMHCNLRMLKRLLDLGADVLVRDCTGQTALQLFRTQHYPATKREEALNMAVLLYKATSTQQHGTKKDNMDTENVDSSANAEENGKDQDSFVYDIFCVPAPHTKRDLDSVEASQTSTHDKYSNEMEASTDTMTLEGHSAPAASTRSEGGTAILSAQASLEAWNNQSEITDTTNSALTGISRKTARFDDAHATRDNVATSYIPVIPLSGIHITGSGQVDLVFDYDSDWSDLGADEDPDSNDERNSANDYPDRDSEDEDRNDGMQDNLDDDYEDDHRKKGAYGLDDDEDDHNYDDEEEENQGFSRRHTPRFQAQQNNQVGHVVHAHVQGDPYGTAATSTLALQQLWGEEDCADHNQQQEGAEDIDDVDDEDDDIGGRQSAHSHAQRLKGMRHRTGMQFASQPREFDRHGLPKYGVELSDDDEDDDVDELDSLRNARRLFDLGPGMTEAAALGQAQAQGMGMGSSSLGLCRSTGVYKTFKPPLNTPAYDSTENSD